MRPLIVYLENSDTGRTERRVFATSPVYIGREAPAERGIRLEHPGLSSWHAQLAFDDQKVQVMDLGSEQGVFLDGVRVSANQKMVVETASRLQMGPLRLRLAREEEERDTVKAPRSSRLPARADVHPPDSSEVTVYMERPIFVNEDPVGTLPRKPSEAAPARGLDALYEEYARAWDGLKKALSKELDAVPPKLRPEAAARMCTRFPMLLQSYRWASLQGLLPAAASDNPQPLLTAMLGHFGYVPGVRELSTAEEGKQFLRRVAELLEELADAVVALEQERDEFGTRVANLELPAGKALRGLGSGRELLAYLLQNTPGEADRREQLRQLLLAARRHPFALVEAVFSGIRSALVPLSPEAIRASIRPSLRRLLPRVLWRRYVREYEDLEEEGTLRLRVLSHAFAREYAASMGRDDQAEEEGAQAPEPKSAESTPLTQ